MNAKIFSILLTFFIFVVAVCSAADDVNLGKKTTSQDIMISPDENKGVFPKKGEVIQKPVKTQKGMNARVQAIPVWRTNFLKALAEMKKLRLMDSLYEVIYSYEFFQDPWKDRGLSSGQTIDALGSGSDSGQHVFLYFDQNGDKFFQGWKNRSLFKLLQFRREEIFNEIFMGLRFSFGSKSAPILVEMNISPFPDKGQGLIIAF